MLEVYTLHKNYFQRDSNFQQRWDLGLDSYTYKRVTFIFVYSATIRVN